jgi:hypothetical protein
LPPFPLLEVVLAAVTELTEDEIARTFPAFEVERTIVVLRNNAVGAAPLPPLIEVDLESEVVETSFPPFLDALVLELAIEDVAADAVST